jgi:hypothetical protein
MVSDKPANFKVGFHDSRAKRIADVLIGVTIPGIAMFGWLLVQGIFVPHTLVSGPVAIAGGFAMAFAILVAPLAVVCPILAFCCSAILAAFAAGDLPRWGRIVGTVTVTVVYMGVLSYYMVIVLGISA